MYIFFRRSLSVCFCLIAASLTTWIRIEIKTKQNQNQIITCIDKQFVGEWRMPNVECRVPIQMFRPLYYMNDKQQNQMNWSLSPILILFSHLLYATNDIISKCKRIAFE